MRPLSIALVVLTATAAAAIEVEVKGKKTNVNVCGGLAELPCAANEWCEFPEESACGVADFLGACRPKPEACIQLFIPVCGCDGVAYTSPQCAAKAGTRVASQGDCP